MEPFYNTYFFISKIFQYDIKLLLETNIINEFFIFLPALISIFSIIGYSLFLRKFINDKNFFLSFFLCLIIIVFVQYVAFSIGIYWQIKSIIQFIGCLLLVLFSILSILDLFKKKIQLDTFITTLTSSASIAFINLLVLSIPIYIFIITRDLGLYGYDTFIFHGLFSKHINEYGNYWSSEDVVNINNLTTLPFFYLLQNFFMQQGNFIERIAVFSHNLFSMVGLMALLNEVNKNIIKRFLLLVLCLIAISMFGHGQFFTLIIEHCLGITLAFYLYFFSLNKNARLKYILYFTLPVTVLMKENFIFLIPFLALFGTLRSYGKIFDVSRRYLKDVALPSTLIVVASLILYAVHHLNIDYVDVTRTPTDLLYESEKFSLFPSTALNILNAFIFKNIVIQGDLNNFFGFINLYSNSIFSSSLIFLLILYVYLQTLNKAKEYFSLNQLILISSFVSYFIFLNFTFVFAMGPYDNSVLSSFERYMSVFFLGFILYCVFSSNFVQNNGVRIKFSEIIFLLSIITLYFINGFTSSYMFIAHNPDIQFVKNEKYVVSKLASDLEQFDPDRSFKNIAVVFDTNRQHALKGSVLRFYLAPHRDIEEIRLDLPNFEERNNTIIENSQILITEDLSPENKQALYELTKENSFLTSKLNLCIVDHELNDNVNFKCY